MSLLSFSDHKHVPIILDGRKHQTTRKPRKYPVKDGDTLHVYFKSRVKKCCCNCINADCYGSVCHSEPDHTNVCARRECRHHKNFFGTAKVTKIEDFDPLLLSPAALKSWAIADGFESFSEADEWFTRVHGKDWIYQPWIVIFFEGDWIQDDAAIMAELEYEQQQAEAEALYEAEMQAEEETGAQAEAEEQAQYEAEQCYYEGD